MKMQEEAVKDCMVKWMQHFGYSIDIDAWAQSGKVK